MKKMEISYQLFPDNFHVPYVTLRILSFIEFPFVKAMKRLPHYRKIEIPQLEGFGYFKNDETRKIWWLFPTVVLSFRFIRSRSSMSEIEVFKEEYPIIAFPFVKTFQLEHLEKEEYIHIFEPFKENNILRKLKIEGNFHADIPNYQKFVSLFTGIKELVFYHYDYGRVKNYIRHFFCLSNSKIKRVFLSFLCSVKDDLFCNVGFNEKIESLRMYYCQEMEGKFISQMTNLSELSVERCKNFEICDLSKHTKLTSLKLVQIKKQRILTEFWGRMKKLDVIDLTHSISPEYLPPVSMLKNTPILSIHCREKLLNETALKLVLFDSREYLAQEMSLLCKQGYFLSVFCGGSSFPELTKLTLTPVFIKKEQRSSYISENNLKNFQPSPTYVGPPASMPSLKSLVWILVEDSSVTTDFLLKSFKNVPFSLTSLFLEQDKGFQRLWSYRWKSVASIQDKIIEFMITQNQLETLKLRYFYWINVEEILCSKLLSFSGCLRILHLRYCSFVTGKGWNDTFTENLKELELNRCMHLKDFLFHEKQFCQLQSLTLKNMTSMYGRNWKCYDNETIDISHFNCPNYKKIIDPNPQSFLSRFPPLLQFGKYEFGGRRASWEETQLFKFHFPECRFEYVKFSSECYDNGSFAPDQSGIRTSYDDNCYFSIFEENELGFNKWNIHVEVRKVRREICYENEEVVKGKFLLDFVIQTVGKKFVLKCVREDPVIFGIEGGVWENVEVERE